MSANKYKPHVIVIPEDKANNDIVNGFLLHSEINSRQIQPVSYPGGWSKVRETFLSEYSAEMKVNPYRHVVLVVDFDQQTDRYTEMTKGIPSEILDRVFVIGLWSEPEDLRNTKLGSKENVGLKLANECFDQTDETWCHAFLKHNAEELERMRGTIRPILFPGR